MTQLLWKSMKFGSRLSPCLRLAALALTVSGSSSFAVIPEPDNILYGTISLGPVSVTATMTNVVVEAYRSTNNPPVATYQMGSNPQIGNFYSLHVPIESVVPITNSANSQVGDTLLLVLRDASGVRARTNFIIVERGNVLRVDFGAPVSDVDGDGLPDPWEIRWFGNLGKGPGDITTNGQTVLTHFIAGTDPNDPQSGFQLHINLTNNLKRVWFYAAAAQGPGYDGMTRIYTLQYRPAVETGVWTNVSGYVALTGANQLVEYFTEGLGAPGYYRCGISLLGFNFPGTTSLVDTDGDGLPDVWETTYFGTLSHNGSYVCVNGLTALQNYIAGTDPNNPNSPFRLNLTSTNGQDWVSFLARRAQGTGYSGQSRYYALESSTSPIGVYVGVAGYTNILAGDQAISYPIGSDPVRFFRARIWLQSP